MGLLRRRPPLPSELRERAGIGPREQVLAHGELTDGWAVATSRGLSVVPAEGSTEPRAWSLVDAARLDPEAVAITVTWVDGGSPTVLHLVDERDVPLARTIHDRVQSSVVHRETVPLPGGESVRVVLRRGADGELTTQVIGSGRVRLEDPAVAAVVDAAEARVREAAGL